MIQMIKAG